MLRKKVHRAKVLPNIYIYKPTELHGAQMSLNIEQIKEEIWRKEGKGPLFNKEPY